MIVYLLQQCKYVSKHATQGEEGSQAEIYDKLTEGRVREDLIHEFVIPPVARQGKAPGRYMLELLRRVLFVEPLWGLLLPLCDDGGSEQEVAL